MMFNATLNNISVLSVLLVDETGVSVKTTDLPQTSDKLYHIMFYGVHDCMGSCNPNYHTITTTTAPDSEN
jgi:hypothetical protein